jgi:hypothetical protein
VWDHLLLAALHGADKVWQGQGLAYVQGKLAFLARAVETGVRRRRQRTGEDLSPWIERRWLRRALTQRSR